MNTNINETMNGNNETMTGEQVTEITKQATKVKARKDPINDRLKAAKIAYEEAAKAATGENVTDEQRKAAENAMWELRMAQTSKIMGVEIAGTDSQIKGARDYIRKNGGYISDETDAVVALIAGMTLKQAKKATDAARSAAIGLALLKAGEYWRVSVDANGKTYKNAMAMYSALFPGMARSTIYNYLNVAEAIYLPYARGEQKLAELNALEPGTAKFAVAALKDKEKKAELIKALPSYKIDGKLSQKGLIQAVKDLGKDSANTSDSANNANSTSASVSDSKDSANSENVQTPDKSDANSKTAKIDLIEQELRTMCTISNSPNSDLYFTVMEAKRVEFANLLRANLTSDKDAAALAYALYRTFMRKP